MGAGVGYAVEISRAFCVKFRGRNSCKEGRVVTPQNLEFYFIIIFGSAACILCLLIMCMTVEFNLCML